MKTIICSLFLIFVLFVSPVDAADDWTQKFPNPHPSVRKHPGMAYIGEDKVLLFGGYDVADYKNDTWVYDLSDNTWTQKNPSIEPSGREHHAMAYIGEDKVLLFGGYDDNYKDDTWVYDLSDNTWTNKNPSTKPPARHAHAMAYIGDDKVVLFGGRIGVSHYNDTWIYDLGDNTWTNKNPSTKPSTRLNHDMSYIGADKALLFGGYDGNYMNDTWVYDLSDNTWIQKNPSTKPSVRREHAMAYIGEDKVLLFGGEEPGPSYDAETWIYDTSDNNWLQDVNANQPSGRKTHGLAETSMDGSSYIVLFGGEPEGSFDDETWTFGGGDYPLAVELSSFIATAGDGHVTLRWRTETEEMVW